MTGLAFGGSGPLSVTLEPSPATAPFSMTSDSCSGVSLAHGATCSIVVTFSPTATDRVSAALHVERAVAVLTAGGTPALSVDPFTFGNVAVGTHAQRTATVTNLAASPIGQLTTSMIVPAGAPFAIVSDGCQHGVAGHGSCAIVVDFAPVEIGQLVGSLEVEQAPEAAVWTEFWGTGV